MNVSLTPELERFVQEKVHSGRYTSASEVVREALRLLEEHEKVRAVQLAEFREEIDRRLASLDRGEGLDGATALAQLRHRSHAPDSPGFSGKIVSG
jgi:antitoxin ParD1/3/4